MELAEDVEKTTITESMNMALCFICQNPRLRKDIRSATRAGKERVWDVAQRRRELNDDKWGQLMKNLIRYTRTDFSDLNVQWHKGCYSTFTSDQKIEKLRKKRHNEMSSEASTSSLSPAKRRSLISKVNWKLCMFCQEERHLKTRAVTFLETSNTMLELSKKDEEMRTRLSGIHDLIAAEGIYHLDCWAAFRRKVTSEISITATEDKCLKTVCEELTEGLEDGNLYEMSSVWEKYCDMCIASNSDIPQMYISRRKTFYEQVQNIVGSKARFVRSLSRRQLFVYPHKESEQLLASTAEETFDPSDLGHLHPIQEQSFHLEMMHVALRLRADMEQMPGHEMSWKGIDEEHVEKIIPESLYLFLRLLFRGDDELGESAENHKVKRKICSIAQDLIFAMSNGRKTTPKHIGLGLALHQATRSEGLVQLFNSANHTVGIDTVRRLDTSIANSIIDKYVENGFVYIPDGIIKGPFAHFSCDNIDVLEETIDGKNTFHCTQMVVWQKQEVNTIPEEVDIPSSRRVRNITPDTLTMFQNLSPTSVRNDARPAPQFHENTSFPVDEWLGTQTTLIEKKGIDFAWATSRLFDKQNVVPGWRDFNSELDKSTSPQTKVGLLPILQANADSYATMTTVIDRFCQMSKFLGQPFTVITVDQPLYSKGKEIVWSDTKYQNVIFIMGGFHLTCNFLKAIGQHMENAGLDEVWVESGVYAANSTNMMLEGKAYYRAIRAHLLTYEALWRIKWETMEAWVHEKGKELPQVDICVKNITSYFEDKDKGMDQNFVENVHSLQNTFRSAEIQNLFHELNASNKDNPNFQLWSSYMSMVEILINFIRAQREGNWALHLESFAAMLPWITVYDHYNYARWGPVYLAEMKNLEKTAPEVFHQFVSGNFGVKWANGPFNQVSADHATEWINRMCKTHNGIIGITRKDQARDRFCITWSQRCKISQDVRHLFNLSESEGTDGDDDRHSAKGRGDGLSRRKRDIEDVKKLTVLLKTYMVFKLTMEEQAISEKTESNPLFSLATNDIASDEIAKDLLNAEKRGAEAVSLFLRSSHLTKCKLF